MSKYNLHDLFEGMSDKEFADAQEKERLENHPERDKIKAIQALLAKEKGMKEDLLSKDGDNEDNVDNVDQVASPSAKGTGYKAAVDSERSESGKEQSDITQTTKPMYEDMSLMSLAKKLGIDVKDLKDRVSKMQSKEKDEIEASARASMAENKSLGYLDKEVSNRIEGLLNIPMKKKFMDIGMDLVQDLLEEDPFDIDDVITHLANELGAYMDGFYKEGDKLAGLEEDSNANSNYGSNEGSNENSNDNPATKQSYSGLEKFRQGVNEIDIDSVSNDPGSGDADNPTGEELEAGGGYDAAMEENMYIDDDEFEMEMVVDRAKEIAPILKGVDMDIITDFVKTHRQDIRGASDDDIRDEFQEFISVNYDSVNEMENLKEHFNRFK